MKNQRIGNFSSSKIHHLTANGNTKGSIGAPFMTYVNEKLYETKSGKQLSKEHSAKATTWGTFVERFGFRELGIEYKLESKKRYAHPTIPRWTGAPDTIKPKEVGDIKCPFTQKAYFELVEAMERERKKGGDLAQVLKKFKKEYYWQLVSNSILTGLENGMLGLFMPFEDQLQDIQDEMAQYDGPDVYKLFGLANANHEELPSLSREGMYNNFYKWSFEIPMEDKKFLTERVIKANYELDLLLAE